MPNSRNEETKNGNVPPKIAEYQRKLQSEGFTLDHDGRFSGINRWNKIIMNVEIARDALNVLRIGLSSSTEGNDMSVNERHLVAFTIIYGRCFTSNKSKLPVLKPEKVFSDRPDIIQYHDIIMNIRNKHAAHSDNNDLLYTYLAYKEFDDRVELLSTWSSMFYWSEIYQFSDVVNELRKYVQKRVDDVTRRLSSKYGLEIVPYKTNNGDDMAESRT